MLFYMYLKIIIIYDATIIWNVTRPKPDLLKQQVTQFMHVIIGITWYSLYHRICRMHKGYSLIMKRILKFMLNSLSLYM